MTDRRTALTELRDAVAGVTTYSQWLKSQSPERQAASLAHMGLCRRLGAAQRSAPRAPETIAMQEQVSAYYRDAATLNALIAQETQT